MKNSIKLIVTLMFTTLVITSCNFITASGKITKEDRTVSAFSGIYTSGGIDVEVSISEKESIVVETSDNIQQYIETSNEGEILRIKVRDNVGFMTSGKTKVYVSTKSINSLSASGGSDIYVMDTLKAANLKIDLSGGSTFEGVLACESVFVSTSGGSEVKIKGSADNYTIDASGGSSISDYDFSARNLDCNISGGGNVKITVTQMINLSASGGSTFKYKGNASFGSQDLSGGSKAIKQ